MITRETIIATRVHFALNALACIAQARDGKTYVNDKEKYYAWMLESWADDLVGKNDHTFTFRQRAEWIQTGVMRPLLP